MGREASMRQTRAWLERTKASASSAVRLVPCPGCDGWITSAPSGCMMFLSAPTDTGPVGELRRNLSCNPSDSVLVWPKGMDFR